VSRGLATLAWRLNGLLLLVGALVIGWSAVEDVMTRQYVRGFAHAIVPLDDSAERKAQAILNWIGSGPSRLYGGDEVTTEPRDPTMSLNYRELLRVCGSATNAFVNVASSAGLQTRRLLLLDESRQVNHVVAELYLDGRWVVIDPALRAFVRDTAGRPLTREDLRAPAVLAAVARSMPGYDPRWRYDRTTVVRIEAVPVVGRLLRRAIDLAPARWQSGLGTATIWLERRSTRRMLIVGPLVVLAVVLRVVLARYRERRFAIVRLRARDRALRVIRTLLKSSG
jgi:hypothetical protein